MPSQAPGKRPAPRDTSSPNTTVYGILVLALLATLLATRLLALGARVFHHDESLFAYYGWYLAFRGDYAHDPLLHGPLQIQLLAGVFRAADAMGLMTHADALARLPAALAGILIVLPLWGLRPWLGRRGFLLALALFVCSPGLWYYSRFCRNETLFLLATAIALWAAAKAWWARHPAPWVVATLAAGAVLLSLKENALFLAFNAATFLALAFLRHAIARGRADTPPRHSANPARRLLRSLGRDRYAWLAGAALAWLILQAVYTCGFTWPKSFAAFYFDILKYWAGQHRMHRLFGEFHYYLPGLALYAPVAVGALAIGAGRALSCRDALVGRWGAVAASAIGLGFGLLASHRPGVLAALHMGAAWHPAWAALTLWLGAWGAWRALGRRQGLRAWLIWWAALGLLQYGYAGEKVPWLSLHVWLPAALLAAQWLGSLRPRGWRSEALWTLVGGLCLLNLAQGWRLCMIQPAAPEEWMVYNHTAPHVREVARELLQEERASLGTSVLLQGEANWPLVWYLRDTDYAYILEDEEPDLLGIQRLVCDPSYADKFPRTKDIYDLRRDALRRAWSPESLDWRGDPLASLRSLWRYILLRKPWGPQGTTVFLVGVPSTTTASPNDSGNPRAFVKVR